MSNIERIENIKQLVKMVEPDFNEQAKIHNAVTYKQEALFALQILNDNQYLMNTALGDQDSLKRAIINVAAVGLTLNPMKRLAYLVPRDKKVSLDISYLGYVQLALDVGAVKWVAAELVCANDKYSFRGHGREPFHEFDPFGDRGEIRGGYCLAKTHDDEFIISQMSNDEILKARDRSPSYQAWVKDNSKQTPWKTDTEEMIKKTLIRRARKSWPMRDTRASERFERAIEITNDYEVGGEVATVDHQGESKDARIEKIKAYLMALNRTEEKYITHLVRVNRRDIKSLQDLTEIELNQAVVMLDQLVEAKIQKDKINENAG